MNETPERIKVWPDVNDHFNPPRNDWSGGYWDDTDDPSGTEYFSADIVRAAVAAARVEIFEQIWTAIERLHVKATPVDALNAIVPIIRAIHDAQAAPGRVVEKRIEELKGQSDDW